MGVFIFNCPHCGKQIGAQDEWEGKTTMCPHCQKPVVIRHEMPNPPPGMAQPMMSAWGDYEAGPPEVSQNAKNAMWFGIASTCCFFCCCGPIFSVFAIVLGIQGLNEISKSNGHLEGKSYAWIGIVLGIIQMLVLIMNIIYAPRIMEENKKLLELFNGPRFRTEQMEEINELPVKPLPEPKTEQKEDSESEEKPQPEENMKPMERKEPIKELPPAKRPRPEELI